MPDAQSGFSVRASGRAKRLSIKVFPRGKVEVIVPRRTRPEDVREFVESHRDWISKARAQFAAEHVPEQFALPVRIHLRAVERDIAVLYRPDDSVATVSFRSQGEAVILRGRTSDEMLCVAALKRWLASLARHEYGPRLQSLAALTGNGFKKMHVRGQRTCWGSHSSTGTISLNYCLLFLAPEQLRYVMIHELCHARHMNHSARFWRHVREFEPHYKTLDEALNTSWKFIPTWVGIY